METRRRKQSYLGTKESKPYSTFIISGHQVERLNNDVISQGSFDGLARHDLQRITAIMAHLGRHPASPLRHTWVKRLGKEVREC